MEIRASSPQENFKVSSEGWEACVAGKPGYEPFEDGMRHMFIKEIKKLS